MRQLIFTWHVKELVDGILIDPKYASGDYKFAVTGYQSEEKAVEAIKEGPFHVEYVIIKTAYYG